MLKRMISGMLTAALLATFAGAACAGAQTANPSTNPIYVDGVKANVAAYKINGNNYFKLRDIAAIVNGSEKQFEVEWDGATQRIDLTSNQPYTVVGGELAIISSESKSANPSNDVIYKDGVQMDYTGYKIGGNNFYKLRDVCQSFDIGVEYDNATQRVDILTDESYVEEGEAVTPDDETEDEEELEKNWIPGTEPVEKPDVGEYSDEYLAYLEDSGEKIVTVTVKYEIRNIYSTELFTKSAPIAVKQADAEIYATTFMSDSSGKGEYTIKMTQSDYNAIMGGNSRVFILSFTNGKESFNGKEYNLAGGNIDSYALLGYRVRYLIV